ncbi:MAG: UDP-N-acetylmuramoyl-tripeptide--D-alanyl-D-alanine ligase [Kiritimatiellae bacterium]|nr:UDP-N-acetylmuramoyl-tripeptide--D-alanyl-D-alanine ligase [Kiritimatiellia bacterium]
MTAEQAAAWSGGTWSGKSPAGFDAVSTDSRTVVPGALYVAIKGERFDGHDFVETALAAGAGGAVVAGTYAGPGPEANLLRVADTRRALRDLAAGYRATVSPRTIGITGSVGKSTVKEMIAAILDRHHVTASTCGNWNNDIGLPLSLLAMAPDAAYGVFEVGSNHPGEIADLCSLLRPDWGVVTNIGPAHLEFFGSEAAVAQEKGELLAALPADGVAFLDADGAFYDALRGRTAARVVSVALDRPADLIAVDCNAARDAVVIEDRRSGERVELPRVLPGTHQVRNLLLAAAVACEAGLAWGEIRDGLATFEPMPMRWTCREIDGIQVVNDAYNANPVSMQAALQTFLETPVTGRRWLVLGDMLELGDAAAEAHAVLGRRIAENDWAGLVTVGDLASGIAAATRRTGSTMESAACATAEEAGAWLLPRLSVGDAVLLKGSRGMHLETVIDVVENAGEGKADASGT